MLATVRWSLLLGILSLPVATMSPAHAESGREDATRAAARSAGYDGVRAFQAGDMASAVDQLGRAFGVVKVPTLGLWYARALVKTGKLVEAAERYGEVGRLEITEGKVKDQKKAQAEAAEELAILQPRIPLLTINVEGGRNNREVILDGEPVPPNLLGMATPVNPGRHHVEAKRGTQVVVNDLEIAESDRKSVVLRLEPDATASEDAPRASARLGARSSQTAGGTTAEKHAESKGGSTQRVVGWISLGLGGVATAVGATTGVLAISRRRELDDSPYCEGRVCDARAHDTLSSYRLMRTLSSAGFIVGAVGLGVGTTLLLTTPKPKEGVTTAYLGLGYVGLRRDF